MSSNGPATPDEGATITLDEDGGALVSRAADEVSSDCSVRLAEFEEAGRQHRHHMTLMFGQTTIYLGLVAGLLYHLSGNVAASTRTVLAITGVGLSLFFMVLYERVYAGSRRARDRAVTIQHELGMDLHGETHNSVALLRHVKAGTATRLLFVALGALCLSIAAGIIDLREPSNQGDTPPAIDDSESP